MITANGVNGQVAFDGQWVTISRKGAIGRLTIGKGDKRIPIGSISAVQWKPPTALVRGFIQFTVPGGNERRSQFGRQTTDAAKDENSVLVSKSHLEEFEALRGAIEAAIASSQGPAGTTTSIGDEIGKLAALHQSGAISEEEFAAAKARLLGT